MQMDIETKVYSRIGMALISAQRIENLTRNLIGFLKEFDQDVYGITTDEFLSKSPTSQKLRKQTLGQVFSYLKLNPKLVVSEVLDEYLINRNELVHNFFNNYLHSKSDDQIAKALNFCNSFGKFSNQLETFFRGFIYFLAQKHFLNKESLNEEWIGWEKDFDYFMKALDEKNLPPQ
jgi:hypothetical protein